MSFRHLTILAVLCMVLSASWVCGAQTTDNKSLGNQDITDLLKAGLTPEVVIAKIKAAACAFDTSPAALKDLKSASVPDAVILAMVQAPVATKRAIESQNPSSNESTETKGESEFIYCGGEYKSIRISDRPLSVTALKVTPVATLACNDPVSVIGDEEGWKKVRISDGRVGYINPSHLSPRPDYRVAPSSPVGMPILLAPGTVRALAYRVIPQETTTYYQSGSNSSYTSCYGSGQFSNFGNYGSLNMNTNCNTTYTTPAQIPMTWRFADVYIVVENATQVYLIGCRANWRWSNCEPLVVGDVFAIEVSGGTMTVSALKNGKKAVKTKYNILQSAKK